MIRHLYEIARGRRWSPWRRLENVADHLGSMLELQLDRERHQRQRFGSVLVLGHTGAGQRPLIMSKTVTEGRVLDVKFSPYFPIEGPVWVVAIGPTRLVHVRLGNNVQHAEAEFEGPACVITDEWKIGMLLFCRVEF